MEIIDTLKKRRSVRKFRQEPVSEDLIEKLITAASWAPSACNVQGWRFIAIRDQKIKKEIVNQGGDIMIRTAPLAIVVVYDNRTGNLEYKDHIQSAAASIQNILLQAYELGLAGCWICHLPSQKEMRKILSVPNSFSVIACIIMGYPEKEPLSVVRKYPLEKILSYEKFSKNLAQEKSSVVNLFVYRICRKCYLLLPGFLKRGIINKIIDKKLVKKFDN